MPNRPLEDIIENITKKSDHSDFIYDLLLAYGISKITITKAKQEPRGLLDNPNQIILKKKVLFERVDCCENVLDRLDELQKDKNSYTKDPRFIIVTDFKDIAAYDTKTKEAPLVIPFKELYRHSEYFLPWTGRERYQAHMENPADVKAAEKMAKIYDEIYRHNKDFAITNNHALNVFLVRLLFCFFAEDTGIFDKENIFTESITNHTKDDGSDLSTFFETLFESLDKKNKSAYPSYIQQFPYVNGHLFAEKFPIPDLNAKVRRLILECGDQNWAEINPDIFGSMFQAVKDSNVRSGLGQHYTSVPNIMKVINPLFMDDLREDFRDSYNDSKKLKKLLIRLSNVRVFDPACGSGNFLIIALKQLKLLEMDVIRRLSELNKNLNMQMNLSGIYLKQFYGIEIDDFACEIARLSLWLAEHQMNCKFKEEFGVTRPTLPLTESGHIVCGNACRLNWEDVCPKNDAKAEIYLPSNPPYEGARKQNTDQKQDMAYVFRNTRCQYANLDYICCWFFLGKKYIEETRYKLGFVTTNSITQGSQVSLFWPHVLTNKMHISFAYTSFKWSNNAKNNAGVSCNIIGLSDSNNSSMFIYTSDGKYSAQNINAYLLDYNNVYVNTEKRKAISGFPQISFGSMPNDGGNLILSLEERDEMLSKDKNSQKFIKKFIGADDYINSITRFCLWINPDDVNEACRIKTIEDRINKVKAYREKSTREATRKLSNVPYRFGEVRYKPTNAIIIPSVSSERRKYIPMGFVDKDTVISNAAQAIYDAELWIFGVLTSYMHMVWVNAIGGKLETRIRYAAELCYNTFPFPKITEAQKKKIELYANKILEIRQKYFTKTLAELYDPDKMPEDLAEAHHDLDLCIESCYKKKPFENDDQRLKHLFKMYELMTSGAKDDDLRQLELL